MSKSSANVDTAAQTDPPSMRRVALRSALLVSAVVVTVAGLRGYLDGWLLGAAALGVALSALSVVGHREDRRVRANLAEDDAQHQPVAETLLANIPDPVILVDRRAVVVEANKAAHHLLSSLTAGHPLSFALRSPDVLDAIERVQRDREPLRVEYSERIPTERVFEVQIGPLNAADNDFGSGSDVLLFFRDLTATRRLERMRADFVANASHELRTPLASLLGLIETLQGPARDDAAARERFLEIMRGQGLRMSRLVDDLLSLSRIEMREHVPPETSVDLASIAKHIVDALSPLARERGVEIVLAAQGGPFPVRGDRDELLRVVENLVENAVKYGEGGARVEVTLAREVRAPAGDRQIVLEVRDYGPGIAPEHLPRLTERFYRVDVAQSREKGGTGLGLAIVKHIVGRHRGQLRIESEPGQGASFKVFVPEHL